MRTLRNNKGFTLIELMIVVVIIGILAALAIPKFSNFSDTAREKEGQSTLKQLHTLQEMHFTNYGQYTATFGDLAEFGFDQATIDNLEYYTISDAGGNGNTLCIVATANTTDYPNVQSYVIDESGNLAEGETCS